MPKAIHIFKIGKHTASNGVVNNFTDSKVEAVAVGYDPKLSEAPLVIGHPQDNHPAFGWVDEVSYVDGDLFAKPKQVSPDLIKSVEKGEYKKISASFYMPGHPNHPARDFADHPAHNQMYLRHVAFLGAENPAVKGLDEVSFSENDLTITVYADVPADFAEYGTWGLRNIARMLRGMRDTWIEQFGKDEADKALPQYELEALENNIRNMEAEEPASISAFNDATEPNVDQAPKPEDAPASEKPEGEADKPPPENPKPDNPDNEDDMSEKEKAREADLKAREDKLAEQEAAFAETKRKDRAAALVKQLTDEGKITPAQKAMVQSFAESLTDEHTVSFSEGDPKPSLDVFADIMKAMPKQVDFNEHTGDQGTEEKVMNFSAADSAHVNQDKLAIHNKAISLQAANANLSYTDAIKQAEAS